MNWINLSSDVLMEGVNALAASEALSAALLCNNPEKIERARRQAEHASNVLGTSMLVFFMQNADRQYEFFIERQAERAAEAAKAAAPKKARGRKARKAA